MNVDQLWSALAEDLGMSWSQIVEIRHDHRLVNLDMPVNGLRPPWPYWGLPIQEIKTMQKLINLNTSCGECKCQK